MTSKENIVNLSELLYYDPTQKKYSELRKGIKEYQFLILNSHLAISHFLNGNYEKFDSLVGENACQIRAIKIALIARDQNSTRLGDLINKLEKVNHAINELLEESSINSLMKQGHLLKDIINQEKLEVELTEHEAFLIQCYFLSEMKECWSGGEFMPSILRKERCSPSAIQKKYPQISYSFVEKLAKTLRILISKDSVKFVRQIAEFLQDPCLIKMVGKDFEAEHNKLSCIPTYWSFKSLFTFLQNQEIPLIFHVKFLTQAEQGYQITDEDFLYFKRSSNDTYSECDLDQLNPEAPACIIQGVSCSEKEKWQMSMRKYPPMDIILAMGADHKQYPDPKLPLNVFSTEYAHYELLAKNEGFSMTNPSKFFVQHIYCAQPIKIISVSEKHQFV